MDIVNKRETVEVGDRLGRIDREAPVALHDQVATQLRLAIASGESSPGEKLPHAKHLAAVLGVNTNTVLRALRILREEGLLELGRGRAITVIGTPDRSALLERARDLIEFSRQLGYRREEVLELIAGLP